MSTVGTGTEALARELYDARAQRRSVAVLPTAREGGLDLTGAYAVEAELARLRRSEGRTAVGRKVGFANKAMWRVLRLPTLVWARMYDDTVAYARGGEASLSIARMVAPRIEPEIVFKLREVPPAPDPAAALAACEWIALGFEFVDCPFPDWKFQPADFVACFGLHAALVVGEPRRIQPGEVPALVEQLGALEVTLARGGETVEQGFGKNALRNPAACLAELTSAVAAQPGAEPLAPGELVSTGTLTAAQPVAPGERWTVEAGNMDLSPLGVRL